MFAVSSDLGVEVLSAEDIHSDVCFSQLFMGIEMGMAI